MRGEDWSEVGMLLRVVSSCMSRGMHTPGCQKDACVSAHSIFCMYCPYTARTWKPWVAQVPPQVLGPVRQL